MAKDPAFLFYPNDFLSGTQFFSDEQVGKFMRILMAQHQHGHLSEEQVIFICKSYDKHIFSKLLKDSAGLWYNERLQIEIEKRKNFILSRSKNKEGKTKKIITSKSHDFHVENEDVNEDVNEDWLKWSDQIVKEEDQFWEQMRGRKFTQSEMDNFLSIAIRNKWTMDSQQAFRYTLKGFTPTQMNGKKIEQPKWKV